MVLVYRFANVKIEKKNIIVCIEERISYEKKYIIDGYFYFMSSAAVWRIIPKG